MAITVGTVTTYADDRDTVTVSTTVAATANPLLLVFVAVGNTSASSQVASVVYNTTESLTRIDFQDDGNDQSIEAWYLNNPSTGTHNVVATAVTGTPDFGIAVIPIYGVDSTDPIGASNKGTGTGDAPSIVVATEADNSWVFDGWGVEDATTPGFSPGANQVELFDFVGGLGAGTFDQGGSYETTTTHGNITMSQTFAGGSDLYVGIAVEVKAGTVGVETASVSPLGISISLPAVTATYEAVLSASVSPLVINVSIPSVSASVNGGTIAADVYPLSILVTIPEVTATAPGTHIVAVLPLVISVSLPLITARSWRGGIPTSTSYTESTGNATSWTEETPTSSGWSEKTPTATSWTEVIPTATDWD